MHDVRGKDADAVAGWAQHVASGHIMGVECAGTAGTDRIVTRWKQARHEPGLLLMQRLNGAISTGSSSKITLMKGMAGSGRLLERLCMTEAAMVNIQSRK